jgi:hypothetical protein
MGCGSSQAAQTAPDVPDKRVPTVITGRDPFDSDGDDDDDVPVKTKRYAASAANPTVSLYCTLMLSSVSS